MATILVVEDDKNSGYLIKRNLQQAGYEVMVSEDGDAAIDNLNSFDIDLCILDIMLPKKDGLSIAKEIKNINRQMPFIFLSARSLTEDRIEGFKAGCDDYVTKPFNLEELLLRIKVVLSRHLSVNESKEKDCPIYIGSYEFDFIERNIKVDEDLFNLSSKESEILKVLVINKNEVVARTAILNFVWGKDDYYASKSLDVYLTKIRKVVKAIPGVEIMNVHGYGYKLQVNG